MIKISTEKSSREQFNKQAEKYSNWSVTRNTQYLQKYLEFCEINADDTLLDVACGSGDFVICAVPKVKSACGIDVSDNLINIAEKEAADLGLENASFKCGEFENVEISNKYSTVVCRMALHHFIDPKYTFKKINECCLSDGKIGIQDIIAYDDEEVQEFFETFEKYVDKSHNRSLSLDELTSMYEENNIKISKIKRFNREISIKRYMSHAEQSEESINSINKLMKKGLKNEKVSKYLTLKDGEIFFKREVALILGDKKEK